MERTETVELTLLCLIHQGDRYLLQNRLAADWKGITLPGGHIEPGESVVDACIREMQEETGLTIRHPQLCGVKQFPSNGHRYLVFLFRTGEFSGELVSSDEGEMRWYRRDELPGLETVADLDTLIHCMLDDSLTEFQYIVDGDHWNVVLK